MADDVIDAQELGRDDGSNLGVVPVELIGGNLIPYPIQQLVGFPDVLSGTASLGHAGWYNSDGSGTFWNMNGNASGDYAALWFPFRGRTLGIRFRFDCTNFAVSVDGADAVRVETPEAYIKLEGKQTSSNHEVAVITHMDLGPGIHFGRIVFSPGQSGIILGMLVEEMEGQLRPTQKCHFPTPFGAAGLGTKVPTSETLYAPYIAATSDPFNYISKILYSNTNASATTVNITDGSTNILAQRLIPANDVWALDFPRNPVTPNTFAHYASGTGVIVVAWGGMYP